MYDEIVNDPPAALGLITSLLQKKEEFDLGLFDLNKNINQTS